MKYLAVNSTDNSEFNLNCYPSKKENTVAIIGAITPPLAKVKRAIPIDVDRKI